MRGVLNTGEAKFGIIKYTTFIVTHAKKKKLS